MGGGGRVGVAKEERYWEQTSAQEGRDCQHIGTSARQSGIRIGIFFTHDDWPHFPVRPFHLPPNASLPPSPFNPDYTIQWEFDTSAFLRRPHVNVSRPKIITWMVHLRFLPKMPQPVRMRVCPEMPCLMTSDPLYAKASAALVWWVSRFPWEELPPARTSWDQVFVIHNHESPHAAWSASPVFPPAWASLFNWTISYREDSDILSPYGYFYRRPSPPAKNYTAIVLQKSRMAVLMTSHCLTPSRREKYVTLLQKFVSVDTIGGCGNDTCQRRGDDECGDRISRQYKFYLAFENALCPDYVTEKVFRFFAMDMVLVVRAGEGHKKFIPSGTYIDTADFESVQELADYLVYLDRHPEDYIKILQAKDRYQALFLDYPMRSRLGNVIYMVYHYEAVALCELCRRLWELNSYRKTVPDINDWLVRGQCVPPKDLH